MGVLFKTKLFVHIRNIIFPFDKIEKYFPKKGDLLDIGCGQGYFPTLLSRLSSKRKILGIDPSASKIREAKILSNNNPNVRFKICLLDQIKNEKFDAISIIYVLYLLPLKEKVDFLKQARKLLNKGGVLILKETKKNWFIGLEEFFMVKTGLTYSRYKKTFFQKRTQIADLLKEGGFKVKRFKIIKRLFYKHFVFIAKKDSAN